MQPFPRQNHPGVAAPGSKTLIDYQVFVHVYDDRYNLVIFSNDREYVSLIGYNHTKPWYLSTCICCTSMHMFHTSCNFTIYMYRLYFIIYY